MVVEPSAASALARWRRALGLDFHVLTTLLFRGWMVLAGAAMLFLLPLYLGPVQLGYHYTFAAILALQIFFELGMNQVVAQITSHEMAHLSVGQSGGLTGPAEHLDRLSALVKMLRLWYVIAAGLFALLVSAAGVAFFSRHSSAGQVGWLGPWILLCLATAGNLYLSPTLAMIEGMGRVGDVARLRLFQSMAGYGLTALALVSGLALWASAMLTTASFLGSAVWLRRGDRTVQWLRDRSPLTTSKIAWRDEIFPFQWRIALSWISGYFIFQLFTPMIFENQGAVAAGRFGIGMAVFNAIQSIGMSWIYSRSPQMAASISRRDGPQLRRIFLHALKPSLGFTAGVSLLAVLAVGLLQQGGFHIVQRLPSMIIMSCLALVTVANGAVFALAVYMRAHKEEPMMLQSVTLALLALAIAHWASRYSVELTAVLYLAVTLFVSLPWCFLIFRRFWNRF